MVELAQNFVVVRLVIAFISLVFDYVRINLQPECYIMEALRDS